MNVGKKSVLERQEWKPKLRSMQLYYMEETMDFYHFIYARIYFYLKDSRCVVQCFLPLIARMALLKSADVASELSLLLSLLPSPSLSSLLCDILEQPCLL